MSKLPNRTAKIKRKCLNSGSSLGVIIICILISTSTVAAHPNIVFILADDMGYGDIQALNPEGKIPTPNLDRLVHNGMTFTDAHSSSAVCTPTRYSLLTGRYNWRTRLANGVTWGYSRHLIDVDRLTVADVLQVGGYRTACIGKWHLGLDWTLQEGKTGNLEPSNYPGWDIDFTVPIRNGPNELGFDYFYGISASLDMHPYVFIENNRVVGLPTAEKAFHVPNRPGPAEPGFEAEEVLSILTKKAVEYIDSESKINYPFFLYFPLTAPHTPILPTEEWQGKSQMNPYADFVMQVDATVGAVLQSLEENNELENTLLIFSSDNGCSPQADFPELKTYGHNPSHVFRGHKADIFEGGHRVPFIVHWPETIKERSANDTLIGLTDFFATCAEFAQYPLGRGFGEDSVSLLPLFKGESKGPIHDAVVHHSINGSFAIRKGKWKLIACPDSGGWSVPRPGRYDVSKLPKVQLYDLEKDIGETHNLAVEKPERAEEMLAELNQLIQRGRSTPGEPAQNDRAVPIIGVD